MWPEKGQVTLPTYTADRGPAPGVSVVPEVAATLCTRAPPQQSLSQRGPGGCDPALGCKHH